MLVCSELNKMWSKVWTRSRINCELGLARICWGTTEWKQHQWHDTSRNASNYIPFELTLVCWSWVGLLCSLLKWDDSWNQSTVKFCEFKQSSSRLSKSVFTVKYCLWQEDPNFIETHKPTQRGDICIGDYCSSYFHIKSDRIDQKKKQNKAQTKHVVEPCIFKQFLSKKPTPDISLVISMPCCWTGRVLLR